MSVNCTTDAEGQCSLLSSEFEGAEMEYHRLCG